MSKKILIITYYWPPAGGPGVQRWLKFVKYLQEFDVEPVVYIPENPSYPIIDESLIDDVPKDITILKQPIKEPYKLALLFSRKQTKTISKGLIHKPKAQSFIEKAMLYIRGNFFIPDARKYWIKPSVTFLAKYLNKNPVDAIITTGPPHSLHLIGLQLKQITGIKWLADFRDPWTTIGYHKQLKLSRSSKEKHIAMEKEVLQTADNIIVTSFTTKKQFHDITDRPITVITNGYDREDVGVTQLDDKFTFSHIGSFLSERNPIILWEVLSELVKENVDFAEHFQLNLVGAVSREVLQSIEDHKLHDHMVNVGYVSHSEAIKYQRQSQVLLLVEIDSEDTKCIIPGKLFEYMATNRPIIAIGPKDSDVKTLIKQTNTGQYFGYHDKTLLKTTIITYFNAFKDGTLQAHAIGLQRYSRRALTETLAKLI